MSILGNNLLAQYYAQQEALPSEYRRVEYLESTGTQYIDTGFIPQDSYVFGFDIKYLTKSLIGTSNFGCVFGGRKSSGGKEFQLSTYSINVNNGGILRIGGNGAANGFSAYMTSNVIQTAKYFNKTYTRPDGQQIINSSLALVYGQYSLFVFTLNNSGTSTQSGLGCRIYYLKLYNTVIERNLIPCIRKSDDKPGLYDLCRSICPLTGNSFYINAGTGEFVTP